MKVLHLFKNYYPPTPGGIEVWIHDIVHGIEGIEFAVLTSHHAPTVVDRDDGTPVVRARRAIRFGTAAIVPSWPGWIHRLRPDVIHVHEPTAAGELAVLASRTRVPIVASYHTDITRPAVAVAPYRRLLASFHRRAAVLTAASPPLLDRIPGIDTVRERTTLVPYGVDVDAWAARPAQADALRERFGPRVVLFLGTLRHYKGVDVLICAMRDVDATLVVAGDGPERESLPHHERVHLVGEVDPEERAAYYHAADVFVLPSVDRSEAFGIVLLEAMACGTPVVSTELGTGTSWVNVDGETGRVVPPRDPNALASGINEVLDRGESMGAAGQRRVRENFSRDESFAKLRRIYEDAAP